MKQYGQSIKDGFNQWGGGLSITNKGESREGFFRCRRLNFCCKKSRFF